MVGRRFWIDTGVVVALAIGAFLVGRVVAPSIGEMCVRRAALRELYVVDPDDLRFRSLAWAFVVPLLGAWIVGLVARVRGVNAPSVLALASYVAIIAAASTASLALQVRAIPSDDLSGPAELRPMFDIGALGLGRAAIVGGVSATLGLCALLWFRLGKRSKVIA